VILTFLVNWWPVFLAPVFSALVVQTLLKPARHLGCIDHPGGRKQHIKPTPLVGGIAIFIAFMAMVGLLGGIPGDSWSLLAAMVITIVFGLADDLRHFSHRTKFFGQLIAALIVVSGTSVHVMVFGDLLGIGALALGKWSYLVTVISLIGLMNAINMIDGIDGLAGTIVALQLSMFAMMALIAGNQQLGMEILVLVGAVAGFLAFNLRMPWQPRAQAFMGDVGGLLLGLLLGWYSVKLAGAEGAPLRPITAVWILAVPLLDMGSVMLLRIKQGKSPFHADRQHFHHVLLDAGYSVNQVVAIMTTFMLFVGFVGLTSDQAELPEFALFYLFVTLWMMYFFALAHPQVILRTAYKLIAPAKQQGDQARRA
jgi:UDP-GlcNAc:undecaprenyl-phosphate GlcNAc-1-phosphate transferase